MTWLLIAWASAGALWLSPAQAVPAAARPTELPSVARLFDTRSLAAWQLVQKRIGELGLATEKLDRANQLIVTKWQGVDDKGLEWLPAAPLPAPYVPKRVRFEVFVSPFAEPARVYVGSLMEASKLGESRARAVAYNVSEANRALMAELAKAFGTDGAPIPSDRDRRRRLALDFLKDEADDCLRQESPPVQAKITRPRKIGASEFEVLYPGDAVQKRQQGTVAVEFVIREDGGVSNVRVLAAPVGHQFDSSAVGAASLLRYIPAKLGGCGVEAIMTYTVRYTVRYQ